MRALSLALCVLAAAGCSQPVTAEVDAAPARDAGTDTSASDAGRDASTSDAYEVDASADDAGSDANDLDADLDADLDTGRDALDAYVPTDIGPFDAAIARTSDPPTHPSAPPIAPFTECTVTTFTDTIEGADHRAPCDAIPYPYYPPSAGPHYWSWAAFETYTSPVPWGFLVHDLEHGALVLAYHCETDADCDPVRAEFASIIADMGTDPVCSLEASPTRFIVVPDPALPVPIAAVAWRNVYEASCLDDASLRAFVAAHYGMGSESLCVAGQTPPDGGTWCP